MRHTEQPVNCPLCDQSLDVEDRPVRPGMTIGALAKHFETTCTAIESSLPRRAQ